jgi:hypothetical protein
MFSRDFIIRSEPQKLDCHIHYSAFAAMSQGKATNWTIQSP